jgi:putative ABC transport system permease protein
MNHKLRLTLQDVRDSIRTQPGRFGLILTAISVGIFSLTILITILSGLREHSEQIIQGLGINVVGILRQEQAEQTPRWYLTEEHAVLLSSNLPATTVTTVRRFSVSTLGTARVLTLVATDESLAEVRQWRLHAGRFLDQRDMRDRERNAVISKHVSELWNWEVGNVVLLGNLAFNIVGVVVVAGGALDTEIADSGLILGERVVFVPRTLEPYWLNSEQRPLHGVDAIFLRAGSSLALPRVLATSRRLLEQPGERTGPVSWVTPDSLIRGVRKLRDTIAMTVGGVSLLSLVLGGTVLMSMMVANIRDRVAEIGLRLALGAARHEIALLFVVEAAVVTAMAGVVGTLGAHLIMFLLRQYIPVPVAFSAASWFIPLAIAMLVGIVSAYLPARSAAKIEPAQALREG